MSNYNNKPKEAMIILISLLVGFALADLDHPVN